MSNDEKNGISEFKFLVEPDDGLKCLICLGVAREPLQHEACGRLFCKECLDKYGRDKPCPNCRDRESHYYVDNRSRRVIQDLAVKCQNVDRSCDWQGSLASLNAHLATCQFALIHCPQDCREMILRKHSAEHVSNMCPYRMYSCSSCEEKGTYFYITGAHDFVCEKKIVACSNPECQQTMQRCQVEEHVKSVCDHTVIPCKYENFGCDVKMERRRMTAHEEDSNIHLHMALDTTSQLQHKVSILESSLQEAFKSISMLMRKVEEQEQKVTESASIQAKRLDDLECAAKSSAEDAIRPVKSSVTLLENKLSVFNYRVLSDFAVHQYERKRKANKTFTCQTFYTHDDGYNLAVEVKANGTGDGQGTHVSAYVLIKQGRNDRNIPWPFVGRVTVILLNQLEDKNHHSRTILFEAANNMLVGQSFGYDTFIHQSELNYSYERNTSYLLYDMLRFRVCYW